MKKWIGQALTLLALEGSLVSSLLQAEVMQVGGFTVPLGNLDVLHSTQDPRGQNTRDGAPRVPETHPPMNQIELTKTYEYVDLGPVPPKTLPLQQHWPALFCTADILKQALKNVQMDVVASAARWFHEWTKQYPLHNPGSGLSRSVAPQLERIRMAATNLNRAATSHQISKKGQEAQRLLLELARLAKLHRRDLDAWRDQVDQLTSNSPASAQFCRAGGAP